jgi:hypothetical protein
MLAIARGVTIEQLKRDRELVERYLGVRRRT